MSDIDTMAEALKNFARTSRLHPRDARYYRRMAQAAIDALQLTQEISERRESYGYYTYPTRSRLVSPWREEQ